VQSKHGAALAANGNLVAGAADAHDGTGRAEEGDGDGERSLDAAAACNGGPSPPLSEGQWADLLTSVFPGLSRTTALMVHREGAQEKFFEEKFQNYWKTQVCAASRPEAKWAEQKVGHAPPHALLVHRPA
jgi:hypothetical protein